MAEVSPKKRGRKKGTGKTTKVAEEENSEFEEAVYEVEAVVGKRLINGKKQYRIKWKGYSEAENTWEDDGNVFARSLVNKFEKDQSKKQKVASPAAVTPSPATQSSPSPTAATPAKDGEAGEEGKATSSSTKSGSGRKRVKKDATATTTPAAAADSTARQAETVTAEPVVKAVPQVGYDFGDQLEEIKGARMRGKELELNCKWRDKDELTFVPAKLCNVKSPADVIRFYESRVRFEAPADEVEPSNMQAS